MSNAFLLFRSLVIYGICLPLAIFLGYLLATPLDLVTVTVVGLILALLTIPLFLRWHYPWLILFWNMNAMAFFLPGRPQLAMLMCGISLLVSILQHTLNKKIKFIHVPTLAWPLLFLAVIILGTARLTGGIGLRVAGGESYGGRRYIWILSAIIGYFALTAQKVPPNRVILYVCLFFLSALTAAISNLAGQLSPVFNFLFLLFPIDEVGLRALTHEAIGPQSIVTRLGGLSIASAAMFSALLAIYGIRGIFNLRKYWRLGIFLFFTVLAMLGGYRSVVIGFMLTFGAMFYLEGLMRSRLLPILVIIFIFMGAITLPFVNKMPLSIQRSLSFVPLLQIDPIAEMDAKGSTEWRLEMWKYVLPQVPHYLILGKGYSINPMELEMARSGMLRGAEVSEGSAMAGDYHNGPLSVIIPFGIFGVIGFLWFIYAGAKVLYQNYKYGDETYKNINTFLFAHFLAKAFFFFTIFGSLYSDLAIFTGLAGLSVAINGGLRSAALVPVQKPLLNKFKLANAAR
jgi:O-Antigen ligase